MIEDTDSNMNLKEMVGVGVHFGHQARRWNPRMVPYILTRRKGIYIINLCKTEVILFRACDYLRKSASKMNQVLIVGTGLQVADLVAAAAKDAQCHYVNRKWLGGTLTNWSTTKTKLRRLRELEAQEMVNLFSPLPKKESAVLKRHLSQLRKYLDGIKYMKALPNIVILVDQQKDTTAIQECMKLNIPTICLVDTDCDPDLSDIAIPANNESRSSIQWMLDTLTAAIQKGHDHAINMSPRSSTRANFIN